MTTKGPSELHSTIGNPILSLEGGREGGREREGEGGRERGVE